MSSFFHQGSLHIQFPSCICPLPIAAQTTEAAFAKVQQGRYYFLTFLCSSVSSYPFQSGFIISSILLKHLKPSTLSIHIIAFHHIRLTKRLQAHSFSTFSLVQGVNKTASVYYLSLFSRKKDSSC